MKEKENCIPYLDLLIDVFLHIENKEECTAFLDDLCTEQELKTIAQRCAVAKMLKDDAVYSTIVNETGASTATVSRVKRSLRYGTGSYDLLFKRMSDDE